MQEIQRREFIIKGSSSYRSCGLLRHPTRLCFLEPTRRGAIASIAHRWWEMPANSSIGRVFVDENLAEGSGGLCREHRHLRPEWQKETGDRWSLYHAS